jgi:hypothetical protein
VEEPIDWEWFDACRPKYWPGIVTPLQLGLDQPGASAPAHDFISTPKLKGTCRQHLLPSSEHDLNPQLLDVPLPKWSRLERLLTCQHRVPRDCSPFRSRAHGGCIEALRRRCGFQPKSRRRFHRFGGVKRSRLHPSPIKSHPYLPHGVHLELFTAAANRQVYRANDQIQ